MSAPDLPSYADSVVVRSTPEALYDLVSDVTRTGEWSPVCVACWWEDPSRAGTVGAWFGGRNETPSRTWETRSQVVAAEPGVEFAWLVGGAFARWGYTLAAEGDQTRLTESWEFRAAGLARFEERYAERAAEEVAERTTAAHAGIPQTLAAIKRIAEGSPASGT